MHSGLIFNHTFSGRVLFGPLYLKCDVFTNVNLPKTGLMFQLTCHLLFCLVNKVTVYFEDSSLEISPGYFLG